MHETRRINILPDELDVIAAVKTDPGCVREANEDSGRHSSPADLETLAARGSLTIIADGMGGHASGEVASRMAVDMISYGYYSDPDSTPQDALRKAVQKANNEIYLASVSDEKLAGMGTTLVILVILGDRAFWAHVGDSRLYIMRQQRLELLTRDHSQVMEMVHKGILTIEQARDHDEKNVILRAVGTQPDVELDLSAPFPVRVGDRFMLCSDGLNDMIEDGQIEAVMRSEKDEHKAAAGLIAAAKERGGHDNITVGIVDIDIKLASGSQKVPITREIPITREVEAFS